MGHRREGGAEMKEKVLVSACLAGCSCRYDGASRPDEKVKALVREGMAVPVCPESLSGLAVPRLPAEQKAGKVFLADGTEVTQNFRTGAALAFQQAQKSGCRMAILKARSPSCGVGRIYDGTFSGTLCAGHGIFAKMLMDAGYQVFDEDTWQGAPDAPLTD